MGEICCKVKKICEVPPDPQNPGACGEWRRQTVDVNRGCAACPTYKVGVCNRSWTWTL